MKYIKNFESYRHSNDEVVNEEIFGFIGKLIGNLYKKVTQMINKTKGGKEVEAIYQKYIKMINDQFEKQAGVDLNLSASNYETEIKKQESLSISRKYKKINEAEEPVNDNKLPEEKNDKDTKLNVETLKRKRSVLDQIVKKIKEIAIKQMDLVLKKYGGASKNPQLEIIINSKKDQFDLDYLNSQVNFLEKAGDKSQLPAIVKQRNTIANKINSELKNLTTVKPVTYQVGNEVIYLLKGKQKSDYDPKKTPEEQKDVVAVHDITNIEGDNYTIDTGDGETVKTSAYIMGKVKAKYEVGDTVVYLLEGKTRADYDGKTEEEQKAVTGTHKITGIEGDVYIIDLGDGKVARKKAEEIIKKVEAEGEAPNQ